MSSVEVTVHIPEDDLLEFVRVVRSSIDSICKNNHAYFGKAFPQGASCIFNDFRQERCLVTTGEDGFTSKRILPPDMSSPEILTLALIETKLASHADVQAAEEWVKAMERLSLNPLILGRSVMNDDPVCMRRSIKRAKDGGQWRVSCREGAKDKTLPSSS